MKGEDCEKCLCVYNEIDPTTSKGDFGSNLTFLLKISLKVTTINLHIIHRWWDRDHVENSRKINIDNQHCILFVLCTALYFFQVWFIQKASYLTHIANVVIIFLVWINECLVIKYLIPSKGSKVSFQEIIIIFCETGTNIWNMFVFIKKYYYVRL